MDSPPQIVYPCIWVYAVIGMEEEVLRDGITKIVYPRDHTVQFSRRSAHGKYLSLHLEVVVQDETERNLIYQALKHLPGVKMIL